MREINARTLWEAALGQLQLQVTRPNYETWLRNTVGLSLEDGVLTVGAPSQFAVEWLSARLQPLIAKAISSIAGRPIQPAFIVTAPDPQAGIDSRSPASPLFPASPSPSFARSRLNRLYTFDTFTVADCNRLAHAGALHVTQNPGEATHNPLLVHGSSGLGKTHLLQAVTHEFLRSELNALYVTAEQFTSEFVQAARQRRMDDFRARYRHLDALLVDDVQFLAGKTQTEEEFFHTFNDLHDAGKQLVLSCDNPPHALALSDRLRSRLHWGLTVDLKPPPLAARLALLSAKIERLRADVSPDAVDYLARIPCANVRELEGALNRLLAYARLTMQPVTLALAKDALETVRPATDRSPPDPDAVVQAVSSHYGVPAHALKGPSRAKRVAIARHVAMYLLHHDSCQPLARIGTLFGGRDHTSVLYACRKIERETSVVPETAQDIAAIRQALSAGER
ncbi:MAG: chromosomal replication initiator protein DnaA [Dehalococcoidia bacterium]|nr:chromosomal replication initiator protein DnaA [Dehalococcoidia bacterium]